MTDLNLLERSRTIQWEDPMIVASAAQTMNGLEFIHAIMRGELPPPPIAVLMGFGISEAVEGRIVFTVKPAEYHYNPIGVVHGGLAFTILDSTMGCAVQSTLPAGVGYTTLDIHVNLLRPITRDTGELQAIGETIHVGQRTATAQGRIVDGKGKLYAHATTTCMIFRG